MEATGKSNPIRILLIDDDQGTLAAHVRALNYRGYLAEGIPVGWEAVNKINSTPQRLYDYIFVDQVLESGTLPPGAECPLNGIQTTREIRKYDPDTPIIVFSGQPSLQDQEKAELEALEAGATRFIYKLKPEPDTDQPPIPWLVESFISQIRRLQGLQKELDSFFEARARIPALVSQSHVGVIVTDEIRKPWYISERIRSQFFDPEDRVRFKDWTPWQIFHRAFLEFPCGLRSPDNNERIPFLLDVLEKGKPADKIYALPAVDGRIRYLHRYSQPIPSPERGSPWGITESVVDITDTDFLASRRKEDLLGFLCDTIYLLGYDHVRIYAPIHDDPDYLYQLVYIVGPYIPADLSQFKIAKTSNYANEEINIKTPIVWEKPRPDFGEEVMGKLLGKTYPSIGWPIYGGDGKLIAMFNVDNESNHRKVSEDDIERLRPFAEEIGKIMERGEPVASESGHDRILEARLAVCKSAQEALDAIVQRCAECFDVMAYVRICEGTNARLLATSKGTPENPHYGEVAERVIPLRQVESPTCMALNLNKSIIRENLQQKSEHDKRLRSMPEIPAKIFDSCKCSAYIPICSEFERSPLGVLVLMSGQMGHIRGQAINKYKIYARRIALAWHDYQLNGDREKILKKAWRETASAVAHRMGNCLPPAKKYISKIRKISSSNPVLLNYLAEAEASIQTAFRIISEFELFVGSKPVEPSRCLTAGNLVNALVIKCSRDHPDVLIQAGRTTCSDKILVDSFRIEEMFSSFVSDSVSFARSGIPMQITISCVVNPDSPNHALLTYEDTGKGVSVAIKERIFEPFSTTRGGTGLGLSIARQVVESHKGRICENGIPGEGVRFEITLPIHKEQ